MESTYQFSRNSTGLVAAVDLVMNFAESGTKFDRAELIQQLLACFPFEEVQEVGRVIKRIKKKIAGIDQRAAIIAKRTNSGIRIKKDWNQTGSGIQSTSPSRIGVDTNPHVHGAKDYNGGPPPSDLAEIVEMATHKMANNFYLAPGEEFTNCPYSLAHRITTAKELTHVTKCRANYLKECKDKGEKPDMVSCRYVFSHQIPAIERDYHEERCTGSGRYSIASHIAYHGTEEFRDKIKEEKTEKLSDVSSGDEAPAASPKRKKEKRVKVKEEPVDDDSPPRNHDRFGRNAKRSTKSSRSRSGSRDRSRSKSRDRRRRSRDRDRKHDRDRSRDRDRKVSRNRSRDRKRSRSRGSRSRSRDRVRRRSYSRRSSSPEYERVSKRPKHSTRKKKEPTPPLLTTADLGDENWDEDCKEGYEPGYDPKVKLEADCILYNPMGLKKSERKKFRLENRKKAKIEIEELPAVEPNNEAPARNSNYSPPPPVNNYKPTPTYPPEDDLEEAEDMPPGPMYPGYGPPRPYPGYGRPPPPHGYGPPHMHYGPRHPHMGPPPPGFYGHPMGMGPPPPGFGPPPMHPMYGRPPHPHYGPHPGMHPHYHPRAPMAPPSYDPPPMQPAYEPERVERRYSPPSPQRDVKPNVKDLASKNNLNSLPEVTAPVLVKRDPDEPFEDGEIDDEGNRNDVKPSQTEDYDWNEDDD